MIKPIDEIPMNQSQRRDSYRQHIREDFQEAVEKGISKFEFVGDYNFNTLQNTAREEGRRFIRKFYGAWLEEHPEYKRNGVRYDYYYITSNLELITIHSMKDPQTGKRRVFCEIDTDMGKKIQECCDMKIEEYEKQKQVIAPIVSSVEEAMNMTVEELNLSVRSYNCLKRSGCNTVSDLIEKFPTEEDVWQIRNLGRKSSEEISNMLNAMGITWPRTSDEV